MIRTVLLLISVFLVAELSWGWDGGEETELQEVVVTATRSEKEVAFSPSSVSVVTAEEAGFKNITNIEELVEEVPGVSVMRYPNSMGGRITLRGLPDQKRTLVLMDGIVLNNPYSGAVGFDGYYPEDIERVEVVRGPASSLYGGYAMGGVVNFLTRMPTQREMTLKAGYGSGFSRGDALDDLSKLYFSYGDRVGDKLSFIVRYGRQETNGFPTGFVVTSKTPPSNVSGWQQTKNRYGASAYLLGDTGDNTQWNDSIMLKTEYRFTDITKLGFTFIRSRYEYDYDDPHTYLRDAAGNPVWSYSGLTENSFLPGGGGRTQSTYGVHFETRFFNDLSMKLNLSLLDTEKSWYVSTLSDATRFGGSGYISNTPSSHYLGDLQFTLPLSDLPVPFLPKHILTFGGAFSRGHADSKEKNLPNWKDEDNPTTLRYESEGKDRTFALFFQDEIPLFSNLTAYLGVRFDWWKTYDGYVVDIDQKTGQPKQGYPKYYDSRSDNEISPKFALVYNPFEKTILRGSVGKAFRPPTVYDLYRTWTSSSGVTYAANPELKPETVTSWDVGIEQKLWSGAKVSLTYFENYLEDLIYRRTANDKLQEHVNVGKAESRGVECEVEQKVFQWLTLYGNATYIDSEITENEAKPETVGKRLTMVPLWQGNLGIRAQKGPIRASLSGRYVGKRYNDDTNADKAKHVYGAYDPFWTVDLKISYEVAPWATVSFSVDNLLDEDYYLYYKAPGRSFFIEAGLKF